MTKQIVVLPPNGDERVLERTPSLREMQKIVGGYVEHVRVLDRIEDGQFIYSSMYVHETGLVDGQPRNQKATEIYQRNVRAAYSHSATPFRDATADWERALLEGVALIDGTPPEVKAGYADDPYICGTVIYFEGFTCEEVDDVICAAADAAA